jgi:hypothetical protein
MSETTRLKEAAALEAVKRLGLTVVIIAKPSPYPDPDPVPLFQLEHFVRCREQCEREQAEKNLE